MLNHFGHLKYLQVSCTKPFYARLPRGDITSTNIFPTFRSIHACKNGNCREDRNRNKLKTLITPIQ